MADFAAIRFQPSRPLLRELSADRLNSILTEIRRNKPLPGRGITLRQTGQGTAIDLAASVPRGGGTSTTIRPFELAVVNVSETQTPAWKIRVYPSTLAGGSSTDVGFELADEPPFLLDADEGVVQGGITVNAEGVVTDRWIEIANTLNPDTETDFYVEIGTVQQLPQNRVAVTNSRYGPIDANICRDWFTNPPTYGVTFISGNEEQP